jgi:SAM-dependent methyltransferase
MNDQSEQPHSIQPGSGLANEAMVTGMQEFKALVLEADKQVLHKGDVDPHTREKVVSCFRGLCEAMYLQLEKDAEITEDTRRAVGHWLQQELLPYMAVSDFGEMMYAKPRGYAGDYSTIQTIYDDSEGGYGRVGELLDRCFLNEPAAIAVKNRREILLDEMRMMFAAKQDEPCAFTSLACGPATEVFDLFDHADDPSRITMTLVDIDYLALDFVMEKLKRSPYKRQVHLRYGNLIHMVTGKTELDIPPQDLVYSIGLIDYFADEFVIGLMNFIYDRLRPGGKVILGNFHPENTTKALMDHVLDWVLIHRNEEDMDRLYSTSKFGRPCTNIRFESQRINLFAECVKSE